MVHRPFIVFTFTMLTVAVSRVDADLITLENGTGTFSQSTSTVFSPALAVDGDFGDPNGWAIREGDGFSTSSQTAVWETGVDVASGNLEIKMHFLHANPGHLLGRFRFSVTTDDRTTFADGLDTGGDVSANWSVLTSPNVSGPAGMTFTTLGDESVLVGGTIADQGIYTVNYSTGIGSITGLRLEALEHSSLPADGPGLNPSIGNFLLTEMTLDATAVPEPSGFGFCGLVLAIGVIVRRRTKP